MWGFIIRRLLPILNVVLGVGNAICLWVLLRPDVWLDGYKFDKDTKDTLEAAVSLGRLDYASALLAIIALMLGLFALVSFSYFKHGSEKIAEEAAREEARNQIGIFLRTEFPGTLSAVFKLSGYSREPDEKFSAAQEEARRGNDA